MKDFFSKYKHIFSRGFSFIEMMIYASILALMFISVVNVLVVMGRSYGSFRSASYVVQSGETALNRIITEVRKAESIDLAGSTLDSNPGILKINTFDDGGSPKTVLFRVSEGVVWLDENGTPSGRLTHSDVEVSNLIFRRIETPISEGVKIELEVTSDLSGTTTAKNFYGSAIMRNSY
ncbi:MAG: hypothetical protein Q8P52_03225 [bacterium]|nr:hypothetical protein [bacterium]